MKRNLKVSVFDSFSYDRLVEVCDAICSLGFSAEFVDNGNIVFTDVRIIPEEGTPERALEDKMREFASRSD